MTVQELIDHLMTIPNKEALVVYRACSEPNILDVEEIAYYPAAQKQFVLRPGNTTQTIFKFRSWETKPDDGNYVDVVELPGN